eukprot:3239540-Rhodomonas_salina.1
MALRGKGKFRYIVAGARRKCPPDRPWILLGGRGKVANGTVRVVPGDEWCGCKVEQCGNVQQQQFRQYHSSHFQEWARANGKRETMWHPLGPRYEFGTIPREKVGPPDQRQLLFNMIVSPTSGARRKLYNFLNETVHQGGFGKHKVFLHMTPGWSTSLNSRGYVKVPQFKEILANSVFTLCPVGHNPEQFRIYEAMEGGSIP